MNWLFQKITKRMFYVLLIIFAITFFIISEFLVSPLKDLAVNLSAGFIGSLITIAFIDNYFSSQRNLEKEGITKSFESDLNGVITMYLFNLVQIFDVSIGSLLGDFSNLEQHPKETLLTIVGILRKNLKNGKTLDWDQNLLRELDKKLSDIKPRFANLREYYYYGVVSDKKMHCLIQLDSLTKKPILLATLELGLSRNDVPEEKRDDYDEFMKKDILEIIDSIENLLVTV